MRRVRLGFVLIAIVALPALGFGQWLRYPTADVPKKARRHTRSDCAHAATARRQAGLLGHLARRESQPRARRAPAEFIACGTEIGGSPLGGNLGRNLPGGLPYQPWAAELVEQRSGRRQPRRSARALPARQPAAGVDAAASHQSGAHAEAAGAALRSERDVPADLHRRPAAAGGSQSRAGTATRPRAGRATRSWCRPRASATTCGSTPAAAR